MKCPSCQSKMKRGQVSVHGTALGFVVVGFSHQHCWFEEFERDAEEQVIVESNGRRGAYRCPKCKTVVIPNKEPEPDGFPAYLEIKTED